MIPSAHTHLASLFSSRWNLLTTPNRFIRWKAMQESALPPLTASRWKESYCQVSTLARAWASYEDGGVGSRVQAAACLRYPE